MFLQVSECQEFTLLVSMEIETIAREPAITIYQKNFNDFKISLYDTYFRDPNEY